MEYLVIGADGQEYGPATPPVLKEWAAEGRISPETKLKSFLTAEEIPAQALPGLFAEDLSPLLNEPVISPYTVDEGHSEFKWMLCAATASLVAFYAVPSLFLTASAVVLMFAIQSYRKGHRLGPVSLAVASFWLVFTVVVSMLRLNQAIFG